MANKNEKDLEKDIENDIEKEQTSEKKEKKKKKRSKEEVAFDKFEVDVTSSGKKNESKTPKQKNPFKRIVEYLIPQKGDH